MGLDVGVLDDQYRYKRHLRIDKALHGMLFRKLVTLEDYPSLGKARNEDEDITFTPADIPALLQDIARLEKELKKEKRMSDEVKAKCMEFLASLKETCQLAKKEKRNVEFIAGE